MFDNVQMTKLQREAVQSLVIDGIKINIVNKVGHRVECHYAYRNELTNHEQVHFVAEVTDLGNIEAFGPYVDAGVGKDFVLNADGERC